MESEKRREATERQKPRSSRGKAEFGIVEHPLDLLEEIGREQQVMVVIKAGTDDLMRSAAPAES